VLEGVGDEEKFLVSLAWYGSRVYFRVGCWRHNRKVFAVSGGHGMNFWWFVFSLCAFAVAMRIVGAALETWKEVTKLNTEAARKSAKEEEGRFY
jgi:hypothetical protein